MENPDTYLTEAHEVVVKFLMKRGLVLTYEEPFHPYTADIYLPDYHAVIEVDGPWHDKEIDIARDLRLVSNYFLGVTRVKTQDARYPERWWPEVARFLRSCKKSAEKRLSKYNDY